MSHHKPSFRRTLSIPGWSPDSAWGYDDVFECYWAELLGPGGGRRIGPERLLVTLGSLSGAVARAAGCPQQEAYLALTA